MARIRTSNLLDHLGSGRVAVEVMTMSTDPVEPTVPAHAGGPPGLPPLSEAWSDADAMRATLAALPAHLADAPFDPDPASPVFQLLVEVAGVARDLIGAHDYEAWATRLLGALGDGVRPYLPWLWAALHPGLTPWGIVHDAALRGAPQFVADLRAVAAKTGARSDLAVDVRRLESLERQMRGEPDPEPRHVRIEFPPEVLERPVEEQVRWARDRYAAVARVATEATPSWRRFTREEVDLASDAARALFDRPLARLMEHTVAAGRLFMPPAYWTLVALGAHRAGAHAAVAEALTQLDAALRAGVPLDLWPPGGRSTVVDADGGAP
jgi:hypothetical protein